MKEDNPLSKPKKKTRGVTRCLSVVNLPPNVRITLQRNELGQMITRKASKLSNYLGTLAKDGQLAPINITDWRFMPNEKKDAMWELVQSKFVVGPTDKKKIVDSIAKKWRDWKAELKSKYFDKYDNDHDCINRRDSRAIRDQWITLIKFWKSPLGQKKSNTNKANRSKQKMGHASGSKSFARVRHEETLRLGATPSRAELFIKTRTRKDGTPVDVVSGEVMVQMKERMSQLSEGSQDATARADVFSQVIGPETRGRVRGLGMGISSNSIWSTLSNRGGATSGDPQEVDLLKQQVAELKEELEQQRAEKQAIIEQQATLEARLDAMAIMMQNCPARSPVASTMILRQGTY